MFAVQQVTSAQAAPREREPRDASWRLNQMRQHRGPTPDQPALASVLEWTGGSILVAAGLGKLLSSLGALRRFPALDAFVGRAAIPAALTGATLLGGGIAIDAMYGRTRLGPANFVRLGQSTTSRSTAFAIARNYDRDRAILQRSDGTYSLVGFKVATELDNDALPQFNAGRDKRLVMLVSRDGDMFMPRPEGNFRALGHIEPQKVLRLIRPSDRTALGYLRGESIGTDSRHHKLKLQSIIGSSSGYSTLAESRRAAHRLPGDHQHALLPIGEPATGTQRWFVYDLEGPRIQRVRSRALGIAAIKKIGVEVDGTLFRTPGAGEPYART